MRRRRLDLAHFLELLDDVVDHFAAFLDVGHFAAAKDDRDDHLVFVLEKGAGLVQLEGDVVLAGLGPNANLLDLALMGVSLAQPLLLLVLELPIIHDAADGRSLVGRDLDEIKICFSSPR